MASFPRSCEEEPPHHLERPTSARNGEHSREGHTVETHLSLRQQQQRDRAVIILHHSLTSQVPCADRTHHCSHPSGRTMRPYSPRRNVARPRPAALGGRTTSATSSESRGALSPAAVA